MLIIAAGLSLALVLSAAPPPRFETLPSGQRGAGDAGRRFLFYFRAKHGDMRLEEVRQVSSMLGYGLPPITPCRGEPDTDGSAIESMGGDVGPSVFQWVSLPDAAAAAAVASRCVLVRTVVDVWASLDSPQGVSWEHFAAHVDATADDVTATMLADLGTGSWRADILSFGKHKPYSPPQKVQLLKHWSKLLWAIPGPVDLTEPEQHITLLEDYGALRRQTAEQTKTRLPRRLFVGRRVCDGAGSLLHRYSLSLRPFLGRTALPPDLAFLLANYAHVTRGSMVLDPFCGSASTLLACAHFGASTAGVDLDERVLCAGPSRPPGQASPQPAQALPPHLSSFPGIGANFAHAGLPPPVALVLGDAMGLLPPELAADVSRHASLDAVLDAPLDAVLDAPLDAVLDAPVAASLGASRAAAFLAGALLNSPLDSPLDAPLDAAADASLAAPLLPDSPGGRWRNLDAIITDPPYGNMEGRGESYVPLGERVAGLVAIASYRLRVGGRLVFLLPVPAGADSPKLVPPGGCMRVVTVRRNPVSIRFDRLLVVLEKTKPATRADYCPARGTEEPCTQPGAVSAQAVAQAGALRINRADAFATPWAGTSDRRL